MLWIVRLAVLGRALRGRDHGKLRELALENLALRPQVATLQRRVTRPRMRTRDRLFWVTLSLLWAGWKGTCQIVQPFTVVVYLRYYHEDRTHLGVDKDSPRGRPVKAKPTREALVVTDLRVGGLHHRYRWDRAA